MQSLLLLNYKPINSNDMGSRFNKVLIISRGVWDDTKGTSSTLTNLFQDYEADKLAHIYIESTMPNTMCCHRFFQISEFSLVHKLLRWRTKTGYVIDTLHLKENPVNNRIAEQEANTMNYVRAHRSYFFSFLRELLWLFNGWKSKELRNFIYDFDPDVVWIDGSPLPLMNRLFNYVLQIASKPAVIFMQDDVYTYKSCGKNLFEKIYKTLLRRTVRRVVKQCDDMFVASPKMKQEYDKIFGFDTTFIAKSIRIETLKPLEYDTHNPIRMVYMGQVIYGRIYSLITIAESLKKINNSKVQIELHIYTNNHISDEIKKKLLINDIVFLDSPVPYQDVPKVINQNDVVLFVETFLPSMSKLARLSFSTKICDYLSSGKCIFAVGPEDIAPMEYFKNEDAAIVANTNEEIDEKLALLVNHQVLFEYAKKARQCAIKNHDRKKMNEIIFEKINYLAKKNTHK